MTTNGPRGVPPLSVSKDAKQIPVVKLSDQIPIQFRCECDDFPDAAWCAHLQRILELIDNACQKTYEERRNAKGTESTGVWNEKAKWDEQAATMAHVIGMPSLFAYQRTGAFLTARLIVRELDPETIIDAPCGFGRNIAWLQSEGREKDSLRHIIAVDKEAVFITTVKRYFPKAEAVCADMATWYPEMPADLLYLQGLFRGKDGPRSLAKNLHKYSHRILIHESEDEFSQDEIEAMMKGEDYIRTRHHGPYINEHNGINTWVSVWEWAPPASESVK